MSPRLSQIVAPEYATRLGQEFHRESPARARARPEPVLGKRGRGRPTKYRQELCATVERLGRQGASRTEIAAALGIDRETLRDWQVRHIEFGEAMSLALTWSEAWWDRLGLKAIELPANALNSSLYAQRRAAMGHEGWRRPAKVSVRVAEPVDPDRELNAVLTGFSGSSGEFLQSRKKDQR